MVTAEVRVVAGGNDGASAGGVGRAGVGVDAGAAAAAAAAAATAAGGDAANEEAPSITTTETGAAAATGTDALPLPPELLPPPPLMTPLSFPPSVLVLPRLGRCHCCCCAGLLDAVGAGTAAPTSGRATTTSVTLPFPPEDAGDASE